MIETLSEQELNDLLQHVNDTDTISFLEQLKTDLYFRWVVMYDCIGEAQAPIPMDAVIAICKRENLSTLTTHQNIINITETELKIAVTLLSNEDVIVDRTMHCKLYECEAVYKYSIEVEENTFNYTIDFVSFKLLNTSSIAQADVLKAEQKLLN